MNNLSFTIIVANVWGYEPVQIPAMATGYISAGLNAMTLIGSCYRLVKRPKKEPFINYIFSLLASLFGVVGNIIFYATKINGKGFWILALGYRSFVWLSCLSSFLPLIKAIQDKPGSGIARGTGKFFSYFAYIWAIASMAIAIYMTTIPIDLSRLYLREYVRQNGDNVLRYFEFMLFAYFENIGFVFFYIILVWIFYKYLKTTPKAIKSIFLFGFLTVISVFTDIIALFALRIDNRSEGGITLSIVLNFIFSDLFSTLALVTVLFYSKTWVFTERNITDEGNATAGNATVGDVTVANEMTNY